MAIVVCACVTNEINYGRKRYNARTTGFILKFVKKYIPIRIIIIWMHGIINNVFA